MKGWYNISDMSFSVDSYVRDFDIDKDYAALELLYPEFVKDSNLEDCSFFYYLKNIMVMIQEQSVILYSIVESNTDKIIGFMLGEEIFPFIINVHIIINKDYRNIYNTISSCRTGIVKLKKLKIKQLVASIDVNNKNAFILLRKLGFDFLGSKPNQLVFSMIID